MKGGGRVRKTHYLRCEGSKKHSKGGRVRKHTTQEVRALKSSQKELSKRGRVGKCTT